MTKILRNSNAMCISVREEKLWGSPIKSLLFARIFAQLTGEFAREEVIFVNFSNVGGAAASQPPGLVRL